MSKRYTNELEKTVEQKEPPPSHLPTHAVGFSLLLLVRKMIDFLGEWFNGLTEMILLLYKADTFYLTLRGTKKNEDVW